MNKEGKGMMLDTASTGIAPTARLRRGQRVSEYDRRGYLIIPDLLDPALLNAARAESVAICRGDRGEIDGVTPAGEKEDDTTVLRRYLCIHFPHKISSLARDIARFPTAVEALTDVIGPNVKMMQSMLFIKSEGRPGQAWHQDETHIPTRDRSLTAVWIALDNATIENGCLWVIPGSHLAGVLYPDREQEDPRFDCTREAYGFHYREREATAVELSAGDALVFDGYLLHRSLPNTGLHGMRRALVNHYMSAESLLPWFPPGAREPMGTTDHRHVLSSRAKILMLSRARPISCVPTSDPTDKAAAFADHGAVARPGSQGVIVRIATQAHLVRGPKWMLFKPG